MLPIENKIYKLLYLFYRATPENLNRIWSISDNWLKHFLMILYSFKFGKSKLLAYIKTCFFFIWNEVYGVVLLQDIRMNLNILLVTCV